MVDYEKFRIGVFPFKNTLGEDMIDAKEMKKFVLCESCQFDVIPNDDGTCYNCGCDMEPKIMYPMKIEHVDDCGNGWGWSIVSNGDNSFELALFNRGIMMDCNPVFKGDVYRADWIQINSVLDEIVALPKWEKV